MKSNKFKERLMLLGGTVGIGIISLFITLTVYNVQLSNFNEPNTQKEEEPKIINDDNLTDEQRKVAENLIAELDKLEIASSTNNLKEDNKANESAEDDKTKDNESIGNDKTQNNDKPIQIVNNDLVENRVDENNINIDDGEVIETNAKIKKEISFIKPLEGEIGMIFSDEKLVYSKTLNEWLTHKALDILAEEGSRVKASADGKIKDMYNDTRYGFTISLEHDDGYITKYSGVSENKSLKIGDSVKQGDVISNLSIASGFEVEEGSHLHFEVLKDGINVEPVFK